MKGFILDENGDVIIRNNEIQLTRGNELTCQTIRTVLNTNQGEWIFNTEEGIRFADLLGKKRVDEMFYRNKIEQTIKQVDDSLTITDFNCEYDNATRKLHITFKAKNKENEIVEVTNVWA